MSSLILALVVLGGLYDGTPTEWGACCRPDGSCYIVADSELCPGDASRFHPYQPCDPLPCGGACCLSDGDCLTTETEAECLDGGGESWLEGRACGPGDTCPEETKP